MSIFWCFYYSMIITWISEYLCWLGQNKTKDKIFKYFKLHFGLSNEYNHNIVAAPVMLLHNLEIVIHSDQTWIYIYQRSCITKQLLNPHPSLCLSLRSWNSRGADCNSRRGFFVCEVDDSEGRKRVHTRHWGGTERAAGQPATKSENRGRWFLHRDWPQALDQLLCQACSQKRHQPKQLLQAKVQNHWCLLMKYHRST